MREHLNERVFVLSTGAAAKAEAVAESIVRGHAAYSTQGQMRVQARTYQRRKSCGVTPLKIKMER